METKNNAIRDARTLGIPKMLLLGLQHMFAMFGATILVPILVNNYFKGEGLSIQVTLFCAGVGTLFFHLCTKLKVPALVLRSPFSADLKPFPNWTPEFSKICPWAKNCLTPAVVS